MPRSVAVWRIPDATRARYTIQVRGCVAVTFGQTTLGLDDRVSLLYAGLGAAGALKTINHGNKKSFFFPIRAKPMKQCGFHWNKAPIAHFPRSLFGNLVADSDRLFLPVDIFPPQDLALGVFSDQCTAAEASETRHKKRSLFASSRNVNCA